MGMSGFEFQMRTDAALATLDKGDHYLRTAHFSSAAERAAFESKVEALREAGKASDLVAEEREAATVRAAIERHQQHQQQSSAPPAGKAIPELPHPRSPQAKRAPREAVEPPDDANDLIGECDTNEASEAPTKPSTSTLDDVADLIGDSPGERALALAKVGCFVFASRSKTSHPSRWPTRNTRTPEEIAKLFASDKHWPSIYTGRFGDGEALLVLDVDPKNGGDTALAALIAKHGELPLTRVHRTPSGGRHFFFRISAPGVKSGTNVLGPGLDVRSAGGLVHFGIGYRCEVAAEIVEAPEWLVGACSPHVKSKAPDRKDDVIDPDAERARAECELVLAETAPASEGERNERIRDITYALRERAAASTELCFEFALRYAAEKCSPPYAEAEARATIRSAIRSARNAAGSRSEVQEVRDASIAQNFEALPAVPTVKRRAAAEPRRFTPKPRSASYLITTEFKPVMFTIENLLPEGVFLLVASPKVGKSWLALQCALAVASGGDVLGEQAKQGDVLFLALEDNDRRLKSRLAKLGAELLSAAALDRLQFETQWPRVDDGGAELIEAWLAEHPEARLIVVDVLERIRPARDSKANAYGEDYKALQALKAIAEHRRVSILVVHHTRKAASDDPMQLVSGTQGLAGAADGVIVLSRGRGESRGELTVMARDLEKDGAFAVEFGEGRWTMIGPAGLVAKTAAQQAILEALRQCDGPVGPTQLAQMLGRSRQSVQQALMRMVRESLVEQSDGKYTPSKNVDSLYVETEGLV